MSVVPRDFLVGIAIGASAFISLGLAHLTLRGILRILEISFPVTEKPCCNRRSS